jgi:hypothetical protein
VKSGKQRKKELQVARRRRAQKQKALQAGARRGEVMGGQAPCNPDRLAPYNSYGTPAFVQRGYYQDLMFQCIDCGVEEVWRATQQKWWYEVAKGYVDTTANRCRPCRRKERQRKDEARRVHVEGLARKQERRT